MLLSAFLSKKFWIALSNNFDTIIFQVFQTRFWQWSFKINVWKTINNRILETAWIEIMNPQIEKRISFCGLNQMWHIRLQPFMSQFACRKERKIRFKVDSQNRSKDKTVWIMEYNLYCINHTVWFSVNCTKWLIQFSCLRQEIVEQN